jgi:hypothetical protein
VRAAIAPAFADDAAGRAWLERATRAI